MKIDWESFGKKLKKDHTKTFPTGTRVYCGHQGSGKTLSLCNYAFYIKMHFPKSVIFSNVKLFGIEYIPISSTSDLKSAIRFKNGSDGVLIILDEAHLYFGRKGGIPLDVLTCISQQRKDRRRLVFSSQIWEELDISLRKQVKEIVTCKNFFQYIQFNRVSDGETLHYDKLLGEFVADKLYYEVFKHNNDYYNRYDTFQKIITNEEYESLPTMKPVFLECSVNTQKK